MNSRKNRIRAAIGLAAIAAVTLAACSSTSAGDATDTSSPTSSAESPADSPTESSAPDSSEGSSEPASSSPEESAASSETTQEAAADDFSCDGESGDQVPEKLVLALVPSGDASRLVESVKPLTDYLTTALGIPVEGVISQNYAGAVEAMGADQAQIGMFAPLPMIQACQKYGAKIVLQSVRYGSSTYHSQFFTNNPDKYCTISPPVKKEGKDYLNCNGTADTKTGPVGLEALKNITAGTKVGLLDPGSSSGYIFPTLALINAGLTAGKDYDVVQLEAHDQSVLAAYNGDVEVGVSFDEARDVVAKDKPDVGQKVVVFAYTSEIPNDGIVVSGKLTGEWQDKITKTLEDYAHTDDGAKVLDAIYQINDLAPADPKALGTVAEAVAKLGLNG